MFIRRGERWCGACRYDLRRLHESDDGQVCPECGTRNIERTFISLIRFDPIAKRMALWLIASIVAAPVPVAAAVPLLALVYGVPVSATLWASFAVTLVVIGGQVWRLACRFDSKVNRVGPGLVLLPSLIVSVPLSLALVAVGAIASQIIWAAAGI